MTSLKHLKGIEAAVEWRKRLDSSRSVGLVPTMGALHEGHLSLVRAARKENDVVAVTIYVNPIQFRPGEDFQSYPRNIQGDLALAGQAGADVAATFDDAEMYPGDYSTYVDVEKVSEYLCGKSRAGHFRGVATVVAKLFNVFRPHRAYFGRKDAQQAAVIERMTRDLNFGIEIKVMPTVREEDGLAMSSRNAYLSAGERAKALCLHAAVRRAQELFQRGERHAAALRRAMEVAVREVGGLGAQIEYAEIVDAVTFHPVARVEERAVAALAVRIGSARLIDNVLLE